jgi:predicted AAA+ superfamily ATPase
VQYWLHTDHRLAVKIMQIKQRSFWLKKIQIAWQHRNVIWLNGVRRSGKTCLAQSLPNMEYFDCELPRVRAQLEDPEEFLSSFTKGETLIFDEVHRLNNPSQLLKIAADYFPKLKILATGSSTLGASAKFKDTLAGRKTEIWLTPMIMQDMQDFDLTNLKHRLHYGGLPPFFLSKNIAASDFQEWMDGYWAKDIQELFRLERRQSFQKFAELLMIQSGGIFEASRFAAPCEISRTTISNYLAVLEATHVAHIIRPFTSRRSTEIVSAAKVYSFDTGFVFYHRGWQKLQEENLGYLWEHFVLNEMQARLPNKYIYYWRDKRGHEVDFVFAKPGKKPVAIECTWQTKSFESTNIEAFRRQYNEGVNLIVCPNIERPVNRNYKDILVKFVNLEKMIQGLADDEKLD